MFIKEPNIYVKYMFILHLICKCDIYKYVFALMKLSAFGVKRASNLSSGAVFTVP